MARIFPVLEWLQLPSVPQWALFPHGLLVKEQFCRVTNFQVHGSQPRSLSPLSTRNFSLSLWQLTYAAPMGLQPGQLPIR